MQISFEPQQALRVINEAKSLALITDTPPSADAVCAMLAFYQLFKDYKKIRLVVPEAVPKDCFSLPHSSVIEKDLGPRKFGINLDTNGIPLEKVTYLMEGKTFKLILHPKLRTFDVEKVSYETLGYSYDLFVFFGVKSIASLAGLFNYDLNEVYRNSSINFDVGRDNEKFATINIVEESHSSVCDLLFRMLGYWKINFTREVSLCLLTGLLSVVKLSAEEIPLGPISSSSSFEVVGEDFKTRAG